MYTYCTARGAYFFVPRLLLGPRAVLLFFARPERVCIGCLGGFISPPRAHVVGKTRGVICARAKSKVPIIKLGFLCRAAGWSTMGFRIQWGFGAGLSDFLLNETRR